MNLPNDLRISLERYLRATPAAELSRAAGELSQRYRDGHGRGAQQYLRNPADVAAYLALRMPATFAAAHHATRAFAAACPGFAPRTLLDLGGGSGALLWASAAIWPTLVDARIVEREAAMIAAGQALAAGAQHPAVRNAAWLRSDLRRYAALDADLITLGYVLGELDASERTALIAKLAAVGKPILLIEPGTPTGFAILRTAREALIAAGLCIAAPCPHQAACPIAADDWCHMAQRINRIADQRRVKSAALGYEDEKFAYLAVVPHPIEPIGKRIIRHPTTRSGLITLQLCTPEGTLRSETITRSDPRWKQARGLEWGALMGE